MNRKYKGGGCGCGGTPMLLQNGGQNNNENINNANSTNNSNNSNNGGLMGMMKSFFGGQEEVQMKQPMMKQQRKQMATNSMMSNSGNAMPMMKQRRKQMATNSMMSNSGNAMPMMKQRRKQMATNSMMSNSGNAMPVMKSRSRRKSMASQNQAIPNNSSGISAKQIKFSNGTSLEGQVANMQQNLNSITGKKKSMRKRQMFGGQNNLATLHNKVNAIANEVHNIKESNNSVNATNVGLFGGERPMANIFLENKKNGGGIFENIGSLFGVGTNTTAQESMPSQKIAPINTNVQEEPVVADLPDPSAVVNKPNVQPTNTQPTNTQPTNTQPTNPQITGGNETSFVNSLFGGYRATKRNLKYLKRYKEGKSIGFTMRSSLKAKGLIPRSNGTRRVSKKYRG